MNLTSIPVKLVECIIKYKDQSHGQIWSLGRSQHGFCQGKSSLTTFLEFSEGVKHVDKGNPVDIYLDFQKSFNVVSNLRCFF